MPWATHRGPLPVRPEDKSINFPAPRGGVFAASHHSSLMSPNLKNAASGGEYTRSDSNAAPVRTSLDFLRVVVLNDCSPLFDVWLVMGALLAAPV